MEWLQEAREHLDGIGVSYGFTRIVTQTKLRA